MKKSEIGKSDELAEGVPTTERIKPRNNIVLTPTTPAGKPVPGPHPDLYGSNARR